MTELNMVFGDAIETTSVKVVSIDWNTVEGYLEIVMENGDKFVSRSFCFQKKEER